MLHSKALRRLAVATALLVASLSSAHAEIDATSLPLSGVTCSNAGVLTFIGGPQTSLQCSTTLILQGGQIETSQSILIQANDAIQILGDLTLLSPHVSLISDNVLITGLLRANDDTALDIHTLEGGLGPISEGGVSGGTVTIQYPNTGAVPEPSTVLLMLLGLLSVLGWKARTQRRTLPVKACQNITQSPMKL